MGEGQATSDPAARKAVVERVKDEGVDFVLLWFTDIVGQLKSFAIIDRRARGRARRRHGLRRLVDHRLQLDRGVGHGRDPGSGTFQVMPWRTGEHKVARMICDVVTPGRQAVRGRPALRAEARARADAARWASTTFNIGPELEYFYFKDDDGTELLDHGGYFDLDDARRGVRVAQGDDQGARVDGHSGRVRPPRGRALPARDRHALRGRRSRWPTTPSPIG